MYKLFLHAKKCQGTTDPVVIKAIFNAEQELSEVSNYVGGLSDEEIENTGFKEDVFHLKRTVTTGETYYEKVARDYALDENVVREWIDDEDYQELINNVYLNFLVLPERISAIITAFMLKRLHFNVKYVDCIAQRPGQMSPMHYDRKKFNSLGQPTDEKIKRYILFLEDQQQGQVFEMADNHITWKRGDVFNIPLEFPHGTANFGYHTRHAVIITGLDAD